PGEVGVMRRASVVGSDHSASRLRGQMVAAMAEVLYPLGVPRHPALIEEIRQRTGDARPAAVPGVRRGSCKTLRHAVRQGLVVDCTSIAGAADPQLTAVPVRWQPNFDLDLLV